MNLTEENKAQLKKIITGIYLTGYDQGYHETHDDEDLKAFEVFWDSSNPNTWKEQLEKLIFEKVAAAKEGREFVCPFCDTKVYAHSSTYHDDCKARWEEILAHTSITREIREQVAQGKDGKNT